MLAILLLERCMCASSSLVELSWMGYLPRYWRERFHRDSGTPGKCNPKTLILVQFDQQQAVCQKHSLVLLFSVVHS